MGVRKVKTVNPMTDNAPELSGQREPLLITGREPVISGMGSKVLADRRGAYLAGNLDALIDMMSEAQQLAFKRWNVKIAVRKARSVLHLFEDEYPDDNRPRLAIEAAERWLAEPTEENAQLADEAAEAAEEATWAAVWAAAAAAWTAEAAAKAAAWAAVWTAWAAVRRAQLRVAYIILQRG